MGHIFAELVISTFLSQLLHKKFLERAAVFLKDQLSFGKGLPVFLGGVFCRANSSVALRGLHLRVDRSRLEAGISPIYMLTVATSVLNVEVSPTLRKPIGSLGGSRLCWAVACLLHRDIFEL